MHTARARSSDQTVLQDAEDQPARVNQSMQFGSYSTDGFHDEMFDAEGRVRNPVSPFHHPATRAGEVAAASSSAGFGTVTM